MSRSLALVSFSLLQAGIMSGESIFCSLCSMKVGIILCCGFLSTFHGRDHIYELYVNLLSFLSKRFCICFSHYHDLLFYQYGLIIILTTIFPQINPIFLHKNVSFLQSIICEDDNSTSVASNYKMESDESLETIHSDDRYCSTFHFIIISLITLYLFTINIIMLIVNIAMVIFKSRYRYSCIYFNLGM